MKYSYEMQIQSETIEDPRFYGVHSLGQMKTPRFYGSIE
jgi:hypothetical protein